MLNKKLHLKRYLRNRIRRIEAFIMLLLFSFNIFADVIPDPASIGTRATKTASGIDQLDIAAPNKNGTSYNSLKELQVGEQGLILNNNKNIVVNTKIAGYVARNRNLDNTMAANLIITEVTGKNRTNINGTVEVAGKRADLVMANRNGIYVNGGNFLNTDRVTLTTGSLDMKNGDLVAINVSQGQIGIGGKGLNALNLTDLELLGKTIDVSGVIKASKETRLLVSAGGQTYEYKTKEVKSKGETYKGIAIDGKTAGSMYAGKIDIISNDKGAGVNTKGNLVSVDDIVITANGDITTAQVDSGKDLKYETTQKVKMNGKTTAAKKIKVKARETEINAKVITGYLEKSLGKKSLSIESEKTNVNAKIEAYGKVEIKSGYTQNNSEIFANEKINIVGNKLNNNNGEIRSQEKIAIDTKETSNIKGYILSDGLTREDIKKKESKNTKNTKENKNSEKGISIAGELDNTEGVIRGREVSLGNVIGNNKGKIDSLGAISFNGKIIVNKGGLIKGNIQELNADKLINDEGKLVSTEKISGRVKEISNKDGEISGTETVKLIGDKLDNFSGLIKSNGKIALDIKETSNVKGYILSDGLTKEDIKKEENKKTESNKNTENDETKEKGISITGELDNTEGVIRGREVSLGNVIGNNKGKIDSLGALSFNGKIIVNKGGLIKGNIQELNADKLINDEGKLVSTENIRGRVKEISNKDGEILGTETVKLIGDKLDNFSGLIKSNGKIALDIKETSNVKGYILSDGLTKEDVQKEESKNTESNKNTKNSETKEKGISITGELDNTEGVIRGREVSLGNVIGNNKGKIDSLGALSFNGKIIVNKGGLIKGNIQELNADKLINDEGKLVSTEKISGKVKEISNKNGEILGTETVKLIGDKLDNFSGLIKSNGKIALDIKETSNVKGYILSDGLTKEDVQKEESKNTESNKNTENSETKEKGISITGDLDNTEGVIRGREVSLGNVTGNNKGKIDSLGALSFNGKIIVNKGGLIKGNIQKLNADKLINDEGKLVSTEKISGKVKEISNKDGEISGTETVKLIGDKLDNFSGLIKSNGKIAIDTKKTSNIKGYILSDGLTKEDVQKEESKNTESNKNTENSETKEKGISITGDLDNTEGVIRGREVSLGNVTGNNKGKIDSLGALSFNGKIIVNKGGLIKGNIQKLNADKLINDEGKLVSTEKISGRVKEISNKNGEILGVQTVTLAGDRLNNLLGVIRSYGKVKLNEKDVSNVEGYILSDGITKEQAQNWKVEEKFKEENKDKENQKDVNEKREQSTGTLLNVGRLDNTKGIIASLSQTTVNVKKIANNDGKIVSRGAVELTTANEYEYRGLVEGDYATTLNAKKIIINSNIDRKNTLSLISKEKIALGQSIRARILSIATQADFNNTKDISATNLLSITAKNIENTGNIYSGGNTYLEAKNGDLINKDGGSIKADKQVYIEVKNGKVVNGTEKYLNGVYRREDGVLVDNRQIKEEKPSIIAGKIETIIKAKDLINTSQIGKAGQGITYIKLTGNAVNASIGDSIAKIEGQKVSVEGNGGVTNIGAIISGTEITRVTSENGKILNESSIVSGSTENIRNIGKIEGNGIVYLEGKEIENIAGNIGGAGGTLLKSTKGNIVDKTITLVDNRRGVTETYTEMREVRPKRKWWRRRDEDFEGKEDEKPAPKKYEQVQVYKYWDIVNKTKTVSGVIGNGKDTILDSAKDLILESSDIRAKDNIVLNAKNNLFMLSTVDTEYKFRTETTSKRRRFGGRKTTTKTWIEDNVYANPVELTSGGYILINYRGKGKAADNKGVFAQGVNFNAKKGIIAKSDGNIYIQGVKDKLNSIYDSHTTKSFLRIKYKRTSDYVSDNSEKYKHSQLYGDAGVTLDSQGRLRIQGVDIQTIGPVYLKGVKGVEILSGNEISSRYEVHTSKSFKIGSDKSGLLKGLKIEQDKNTKEMDRIKSIGSIINSKGSTVTIEGDSIVSVGSKIGAADDINLIGEHGVVIKDGENFAKIREENEKMRANLFASWSLKNLSAGIGVEAVYDKTNDGKTIVTPEKNIIVTNKNLNITSSSGNIFMQGDFGAKEDINVKAEKGKIFIQDSKSEVLTDSKSINARMALALGINLSGFKDTLKSYKSQLKAIKEIGNLGRVISFTRDMAKGKSLLESLDGKEDTINAISTMYNGPSTGTVSAGIDVTGNINVSKSTSKYLQNITTNIRAGKDITFKSKEFETEGSFIRAENDLSIDASKILIQASADKYATNSKNMGANFGVTLTGTNSVSGGLNYGQMNSKGTLYNNAQIQAGNKLIVKADNMTIRGGRLEGKHTDVDVKKNLLIESLQDSEEMKQVGTNVGYSLKKDKTQDGSLGLSFGGKDKKWVKEQSGIIGRESVKVKVGDTTKLIGSIIGGKNIELRTGKLEYSDIYDKDKGYDIGLNSKATISKNDKDEWNISKTIGVNFGAKDKAQINRATIGAGTIIVGGKVVSPDINRNESVAQEVTKNINVDGISVEYKDNRRRWSDISDIMGEYGKSLGSDLDDLTGRKYNLENKLSTSISNFVFEVEKVLDHHLGNKYIGLIPTKEYRGGIIGQFQEFKTRYFDGTQKLYITETKIMKDEKGHTMFDKDGVPLLSTKTRELKPGETVGKDVRKVVTLNGVFNNKMEAIAGGLASTITANENKALLAGKTIKSVVIHNESGGLVVDATETLVTKFGGLLWNQNWGAKKLEGMFKDNPWIMEKMNWHSQGSIYGAAAMIHFLDTEEGKAIAKKNLGTVGIKGIAITALGYGKLDRRIKALGTKAQLYYMRNIGDWVSFIAAQGMKRNTNGHGHDNVGYNDDNYNLNEKTGIYERIKIKVTINGKEEEIAVPNYEYKIGEMDGKDMRSIIERWEDKRTQEKWYGGK